MLQLIYYSIFFMIIKNWFRSQSYWVQGGILVELLALIVFLILFAFGDRLEISGGLFSLPAWAMIFFPAASLIEDIPNELALILVYTIFFYFFSGALLGFLVTLWKKFIKKQQIVFFH